FPIRRIARLVVRSIRAVRSRPSGARSKSPRWSRLGLVAPSRAIIRATPPEPAAPRAFTPSCTDSVGKVQSMTAPRLFNLDTVMIDVLLKVVALPIRGSDTLASQHLITTGGGFNVMSAATRHGLGAVYAGRLGEGPFSDLARDALRGEEVDTPIAAD